MDVTLLCDVVDNYGDIGVVYRLSRALSSLSTDINLTLVVSNLTSFSQMAPNIKPTESIQEYNGWTILDWNNAAACTDFFTEHHPRIILQCFQCIRPDWLESILFNPERNNTKEIIHIINVEYLTAEEWADGFHLLKSATRSSFVKKRNFMPGFTCKTGGLILDPPFMENLHNKDIAIQKTAPYLTKHALSILTNKNIFKLIVFTYEQDFAAIVESLVQLQKTTHRDVCVFVAPGLSEQPFMSAIKTADAPVQTVILPYMQQTAWDALLCCMDFAMIRGEDSFARVCLCGIPFLWHAYQQDEEFQIVKVAALLHRMKPFFPAREFALLQTCMILFNRRPSATPGKEAKAELQVVMNAFNAKTNVAGVSPETIPYTEYFCMAETLRKGFSAFAEMLVHNGNMAENLLDYMKQLQF
ncbi:MAG: elongation factor P maturation arginine rhamnosyltransferase EarP [Treponema sp.]|nr:elongation factor P maturation arginine rhamnosyltransferase EarP [Treponema sp.]